MPKFRILLLEFLHQFAVTFFLYGVPFYARQKFGWQADKNLLAQSLAGLCIAVGAFLGGQIAHRTDPRRALSLAAGGCLLTMVAGGVGIALGPLVLVIALASFSFWQALAWPGIEAMLMAGETGSRISHFVTSYNLTWSSATTLAFFVATPLLTGIGPSAIWLVPGIVHLAMVAYFAASGKEGNRTEARGEDAPNTDAIQSVPSEIQSRRREAFRWLGWLANPLGSVAINVVVAYNPTVQSRLGLTLAQASLWLSLWFVTRTIGFELLRRWTWWHYRWRFLCGVFALTMLSFAGLILADNLPLQLLCQALFGLCVGLLYQSSLFYSMADSDAQGAHGGFHECFIGLGIMLGPFIAWAGTHFAPQRPAFPIWLVLALMGVGLVLLVRIGLLTERGNKGE